MPGIAWPSNRGNLSAFMKGTISFFASRSRNRLGKKSLFCFTYKQELHLDVKANESLLSFPSCLLLKKEEKRPYDGVRILILECPTIQFPEKINNIVQRNGNYIP